jgi:uncharacterized membrane-anchored protein
MKPIIHFFLSSLLIFGATSSQAQSQAVNEMAALNWVKAPNTVKITERANMKLTGSLLYLDEIETNKFLKLTGNLPSNGSYTLLNGKDNWFSIFHFTAEGYVKDDEKIDANALLKALKEGNEAGLAERKK